MATKKSSTPTKGNYTLWIEGGDSLLRDPTYYNMVLDTICSLTTYTNIQTDQILSVSVLRGTPKVALLENTYEVVEALFLALENCGIKSYFDKTAKV